MRALNGIIMLLVVFALVIPSVAAAQGAGRQAPTPAGPPEFDRIGMSGPRFGLTVLQPDTKLAQRAEDKGVNGVFSVFGWHFERRLTPTKGGPEFVVETVPMIGGVEYGVLIPTVTLAMGVRFPSGWEFGIGPNVTGRDEPGKSPFATSLITAVGYSFRYAGVNLPVNLALGTNPDGNRVSLVFGYAIQR